MSSPAGATTPIFDALVTEIGLRWPDRGPGDTRPRAEAKHQAAKPVSGNSRPGARRDEVGQNGDQADHATGPQYFVDTSGRRPFPSLPTHRCQRSKTLENDGNSVAKPAHRFMIGS